MNTTRNEVQYKNNYPTFSTKEPPVKDSDRIYPCSQCGNLRSKEEGGLIFSLCDKCFNERFKIK